MIKIKNASNLLNKLLYTEKNYSKLSMFTYFKNVNLIHLFPRIFYHENKDLQIYTLEDAFDFSVYVKMMDQVYLKYNFPPSKNLKKAVAGYNSLFKDYRYYAKLFNKINFLH